MFSEVHSRNQNKTIPRTMNGNILRMFLEPTMSSWELRHAYANIQYHELHACFKKKKGKYGDIRFKKKILFKQMQQVCILKRTTNKSDVDHDRVNISHHRNIL